MMADYNGWSNRETWNAALWVNNDEGLYNGAQRLLLTHDDPAELAPELESYCRGLWPNGLTPDGDDLDTVDWREFAEAELSD